MSEVCRARHERSRVRVGTDLQEVAEVADAVRDFGTRYTTRIYTERELAGVSRSGAPSAQALAARFAAKEAVLKTLRAGDAAVDLREVEIIRAADGAPGIVLHGAAAELAATSGLHSFEVSLSHVASLATATVVALCDARPEEPVAEES